MKVYFVRHIPSGKYLPAGTGRGGRGGSHVEADEPEKARIFRSHRSAKIALNAWLKGKWVTERGQYYEGDYYEDTSIVPQPHRKFSEMEIIEKEIEL